MKRSLRLAEYLKLSSAQVIDRYCRKIGEKVSLQEHRSPQGLYDCVFLAETTGGKNGRRSA